MLIHEHFIIKFYDCLDSTQTEAKQQIDISRCFHNYVIATSEQSNGRAKNIRKWQNHRGDLATTIILKPGMNKELYPQITYIAGIAVGNTIKKLAVNETIHHKWVNDVLLNQRKVSGILVESYKDDFVLVGIGINILSKININEFQAIGLEDIGIKIQYKTLLKNLLSELYHLYQDWLIFGFIKLRNLWLARAYKLNENIEIMLDDKKIYGIFSGIDQNGNLELNQNGKVQKICAGDVFL